MKTRSEILEETRKLLVKIDPIIWDSFREYVRQIDLALMETIPEKEKTALLKGAPSATIGALAILMRQTIIARDCAPGAMDDLTTGDPV
jgi:hypothetical protein